MNIIPNRSIISNFLYFLDLCKFWFLLWLFCQIMAYVITFAMLILAIKYAAYLPDNPKYRRNYDDIKVAPANPFTEAPKVYPRNHQ